VNQVRKSVRASSSSRTGNVWASSKINNNPPRPAPSPERWSTSDRRSSPSSIRRKGAVARTEMPATARGGRRGGRWRARRFRRYLEIVQPELAQRASCHSRVARPKCSLPRPARCSGQCLTSGFDRRGRKVAVDPCRCRKGALLEVKKRSVHLAVSLPFLFKSRHDRSAGFHHSAPPGKAPRFKSSRVISASYRSRTLRARLPNSPGFQRDHADYGNSEFRLEVADAVVGRGRFRKGFLPPAIRRSRPRCQTPPNGTTTIRSFSRPMRYG